MPCGPATDGTSLELEGSPAELTVGHSRAVVQTDVPRGDKKYQALRISLAQVVFDSPAASRSQSVHLLTLAAAENWLVAKMQSE